MKLTLLLLALTTGAAFAATEENITTNLPATSGGSLVVDVDFGNIEVTTNSTDDVAIHVWRKISWGSAEKEKKYLSDNSVVIGQEGNTVTVRSRPKVKEKSGWFGGFGKQNEAKYTIQVPARFNARPNTSGGDIVVSNLTGEVKADTSGGELRFVQLHGTLNGGTSGGNIHAAGCDGPIKLRTSGGDIQVIDGAGSLEGGTSGGDITVRTFLGAASVHTSGGSLKIENVAGQIEGGTSGGSVLAVLVSPLPGKVSLGTSGGDVTVKVPKDAAFNLNAETSGGDVRCDLPVTVQGKLKSDRIQGPVNGGGPELKLRTSGGNIHVKKM